MQKQLPDYSVMAAELSVPKRRLTRRLGQSGPVKYWEIIADRLHAQGWSYGIAEHFTEHGLLFCVDAHRDGFVKADDLLTAFLSLEKRRASAKRR